MHVFKRTRAGKRDDNKKLFELFGKCLKLGMHVLQNEPMLLISRITSLKVRDGARQDQNEIYHFTGEGFSAVSSSYFLEALPKKGLEVFFFVGPIDEYATQHLKEYEDKGDNERAPKQQQTHQIRRSEKAVQDTLAWLGNSSLPRRTSSRQCGRSW